MRNPLNETSLYTKPSEVMVGIKRGELSVIVASSGTGKSSYSPVRRINPVIQIDEDYEGTLQDE